MQKIGFLGLDRQQILDILMSGALANPMFGGKGPMILQEEFPTSFPLKLYAKKIYGCQGELQTSASARFC